jgi:hypothetical protein
MKLDRTEWNGTVKQNTEVSVRSLKKMTQIEWAMWANEQALTSCSGTV